MSVNNLERHFKDAKRYVLDDQRLLFIEFVDLPPAGSDAWEELQRFCKDHSLKVRGESINLILEVELTARLSPGNALAGRMKPEVTTFK